MMSPGAPSEALIAAADALWGEGVGEMRAELRIVATRFRAEAFRRSGALESAIRAADDAATASALLGHVWLELDTLRWIERLRPSLAVRERRTTLLRRVVAGIDAADLRDAVVRAWSDRG
jgi:hypothetical protein